jgi:hypothetical protein
MKSELMKYVIFISSCLLAACSGQKGGPDTRAPLPPVAKVCGDMYSELKLQPSTTTFRVEVDIEDISPSGDGNISFYAVCNDEAVLTPTTAFGPGNIEFKSGLPATIYVRLIPSSGVTWKTISGQRDPSIDLIDKDQEPAAGDWPYCGNPNPVPKRVTAEDPTSNHQYISFQLCPPVTPHPVDKSYKYRINLSKAIGSGSGQPYELDPQIIHHAP